MWYLRAMCSNKAKSYLALGAVGAALCLLPACSVSVKDKNSEGAKHVDIQSPVGDLHVSEQADMRDSGLSVYPGAKPAPKDNSDDEKSANVNLAVPGFSLKVVAGEFLSDDSTDKILSFYDKELQKYGKPIRCTGGWGHGDVDSHSKDDLAKPVTCDKGNGGDSVELKVGTEGNQHIVSVKKNDKGARFALVYVKMHVGKDETI